MLYGLCIEMACPPFALAPFAQGVEVGNLAPLAYYLLLSMIS